MKMHCLKLMPALLLLLAISMPALAQEDSAAVKEKKEPSLHIYFTAEDDSIPINFPQPYSIKIYDRWGQLMFSTENSQRWDGYDHLKNKACAIGTYYFVAHWPDNKGGKVEKKGTITLLREPNKKREH